MWALLSSSLCCKTCTSLTECWFRITLIDSERLHIILFIWPPIMLKDQIKDLPWQFSEAVIDYNRNDLDGWTSSFHKMWIYILHKTHFISHQAYCKRKTSMGAKCPLFFIGTSKKSLFTVSNTLQTLVTSPEELSPDLCVLYSVGTLVFNISGKTHQ